MKGKDNNQKERIHCKRKLNWISSAMNVIDKKIVINKIIR